MKRVLLLATISLVMQTYVWSQTTKDTVRVDNDVLVPEGVVVKFSPGHLVE